MVAIIGLVIEGTICMAKSHSMKQKTQKNAELAVGRIGRIRFGLNDVQVIVVEDRGSVGSAGRRLVRVRFAESEGDPDSTFEVPADELVLTPAVK
jgi:hypothetical protein